MKSFCVLNCTLTAAAGEKLGAASAAVVGGKVCVLSCPSDGARLAAQRIAKGIKKGGGCALVFENAFESQVAFACSHYCPDAAFFVDGDKKSRITLFSACASAISQEQENLIFDLALNGEPDRHRGGTVLQGDFSAAYLIELSKSINGFEDVTVSLESKNPLIRSALRGLALRNGASLKGKTKLFISRSGLKMSAVDENGVCYTHEELYDICAAFQLKEGIETCVSFYSSRYLDELACQTGAVLRRSFDSGKELWQKDAVFMTVKLMDYMARYGCGLSEMSKVICREELSRKRYISSASLSDVAASIDCEELITDEVSGVYAKSGNSGVLVTPCSGRGRVCFEIFAESNEAARELSLSLVESGLLDRI